VRTLSCGLLLCVLTAAPAAAQDDETRPALPTIVGDTGLWTVPTAEVLPKGKISGSVFLASDYRPQGVTLIEQIGPTVGFGLTSRVEIFGSWRYVGVDRDTRPIFNNGVYGGVAQDVPFMRQGWEAHGGPTFIGGKVNFLSQSRNQPLALAFRAVGKAPTGSTLIQDD